MKIIKAGYQILTPIDTKDIMQNIEYIARTCYKSEDKMTEDSADKLVKHLIDRGHEAMLEHESISVKFIVDRGVSHELVRHRMASFAQESTRYCNYSKDKFGNEITVIEPCFFEKYVGLEQKKGMKYQLWEEACKNAEVYYFALLNNGVKPEEARSVLPNSLKTEIVVTANLREWRHILKLRTPIAAHPQMREVMRPLALELTMKLPIIFGDLEMKE